MNKEDKKLQEHLVNEMMKVNETNPDVMIYMQSLMKCYEDLEQENQQLKENYDRIYNENCKLREEHNITDISLLDENQQLKKQKDDVVEYIKEIKKHREEGLTITEYKTKWRSMFDYLESDEIINNLLRMLGEIE